jgi:xanthine dehydrogenase small subunit
MISFILNDKLIRTDHSSGMTLLDFIRYNENLKGTKIGCREGDCGACTVLEGCLSEDSVNYKTIVSCLTPLGNAHGKHIVTIEGLNMQNLSPVQSALVNNNGTQCGFCTPGFTISLTAFLLSHKLANLTEAIEAVDGNICRCTGYKSIERAALELVSIKRNANENNIVSWLIDNNYLPAYFNSIPNRLKSIVPTSKSTGKNRIAVGGGTDLYVQIPDQMLEKDIEFVNRDQEKEKITIRDNNCRIQGNATASDIMQSSILQKYFPHLHNYFTLISSSPIRNMGTIAGNMVNASPIGDLSILFLALDANVRLSDQENKIRSIMLKDFFLDYKKLNLQDNEIIKSIEFALPQRSDYFNFEKVSKRKYLDIASVNSAIKLTVDEGIIKNVHFSAGGVSPIPKYLVKASDFLVAKEINAETVIQANNIAQEEISPISDIRGSADYKRLLMRQLLFAHFIELFPDQISLPELLQKTDV